MLPDLLKDPKQLNLFFSAVVLVIGLVSYWIHPVVFHQHRFMETAFEFWVLKWMAFVMTWGLLTATTDLRFPLAAIDLTSVISFGFAIAFWSGDAYDERHTVVNLVFLFGLLFSWNFVAHSILGAGRAWIFPSMTMSLVCICAMATVVLLRYHATGIMFALVSAAYLILQMPTYELIFLGRINTDPEIIRWLAFTKFLYGGLFYAVFWAPIKSFDKIRIPSLPLSNERLRRAATWTAAAIGGGILTEIVLWLGKQTWRLVTGHPIST